MRVIELRAADTNQEKELEALLDSVHGGTESFADATWTDVPWLTDLYYDKLANEWSADSLLICINEGYFEDWEFTDENVESETGLPAEEISDSHRLKLARDYLDQFSNSDALHDAPVIMFIRLLGQNNRDCSLILGAMCAGQGGMQIDLVDAFVDGDFDAELRRGGWIDADSLPKVSDDWILARWSSFHQALDVSSLSTEETE